MSVAPETLRRSSETGDPVARLLQSDVTGGILLRDLLAIQCQVIPAAAAAILEIRPDGGVRTVAAYSESGDIDESDPWLRRTHELAMRCTAGRQRLLAPLDDSASSGPDSDEPHILMIPVPRSGSESAAPWVAACLVISAADAHTQQTRLQLTVGLVGISRLRRALEDKSVSLERLRTVLETVAAVGSEKRFRTAAMRLCNEMAVRWECERVSLGFVKNNGVELRATSFADDFARHMQVVLDLQATMEECYDQDVEISYPDREDSVTVTRAAERLAQRHASNAVLSLPLRRGEEVVGIVTAERAGKQPLQVEEIEAARLTCELCTPRICDLHERDRWVGARWACAARKSLGALVVPKHT